MTVAEFMTPHPVTVGLDEPIPALLELFADHHCHHLLVVDKGALVGVISDRDVLRHVSPFAGTLAEQRRDLDTVRLHAHQIMTREPLVADPDEEIDEVAGRLLRAGISCLPVVRKSGRLVGVLTWRDLLRALLSVQPPLLRGV